MKASIAAATLLSIAPAFAATALYGQCGGENFTGDTTCASGSTCVYSNPYYSQCLASDDDCDASSATPETTTATTPVSTPTSAVANPVASSSTSVSTSAASTALASSSASAGTSYKASFTWYGSGDTFGSPNCQTNTAACSFYTSPGYAATVSQNEFGVGPGQGAGPACGTCWKLTGQTDSSGNALSGTNSIVVMVNNLCPASGNPLCSQNGLSGTNQYGANLNFDLCSDSGAKTAFFGSSGVGLAVGTAEQVSCSDWSGTVVH